MGDRPQVTLVGMETSRRFTTYFRGTLTLLWLENEFGSEGQRDVKDSSQVSALGNWGANWKTPDALLWRPGTGE